MRVKLRDIAERACVSTATVSRVLNDNPNVDERTRMIVLQSMRELGYPMHEAKAYSAPRDSQGITVAIRGTLPRKAEESQTHGGDSFGELIVNGIEARARHFGMQMRMQRVMLEDPTPSDLVHLVQSDGVIIIGGIIHPLVIETLEQAHVPFVLAAARLNKQEINCVYGDYLNGAAQAIEALVASGHHRIALVNGPAITTTSQDKLAGYRLGLSEANLHFDQQLITTADDFHPQAGYAATRSLLDHTRDFDAILYASDAQAIGGLRALKEAGIKIPEQVSVIGFYDEPFAPFTDPPLSSVHLDWQRVGEVTTSRLTTILKDIDSENLQIVLPMKLTLRSSTAHKSTEKSC